MSLSMVLYNINSNIQINNIIRSNYYIAYEYYMHVISINWYDKCRKSMLNILVYTRLIVNFTLSYNYVTLYLSLVKYYNHNGIYLQKKIHEWLSNVSFLLLL